jgi:hypothetical protein
MTIENITATNITAVYGFLWIKAVTHNITIADVSIAGLTTSNYGCGYFENFEYLSMSNITCYNAEILVESSIHYPTYACPCWTFDTSTTPTNFENLNCTMPSVAYPTGITSPSPTTKT